MRIQRWYNNRRWTRRRKHQLDQHPLCAMCLQKAEVVAANVADHVVPHNGDYQLFWFGELQSLCHHHHDRTKQQIEKLGFATDIGVDGWPVDAKHPANRER